MVSADWSHGETPSISIGIDKHVDDGDQNHIVDDTQIEISLPELIDGFIYCIASGESTISTNSHDNLPIAYEAMISYLQYIQNCLKEKKQFLELRKSKFLENKEDI